MASDPLACQCKRWGTGCESRATQEDLLCDGCRAGCSLIQFTPGPGPDGLSFIHVRIADLQWTVPRTGYYSLPALASWPDVT